MSSETLANTAFPESKRAVVRFNAQHISVLCPLGHVLESRRIEPSLAGSMFEAELGGRRPGDRFDRMAARCQGAGHPPLTIPARLHFDDPGVGVTFDAVPWFKVATRGQVVELFESAWNGAGLVDFFAEDNPDVRGVLAQVDAARRGGDVRLGHADFGCSVDEDAALAWIRAHRPELDPENDDE